MAVNKYIYIDLQRLFALMCTAVFPPHLGSYARGAIGQPR
jgi:hypothetical protein